MSAPDSRGRHHVPAVRALAGRLGVDLGAVDGTGAGQRVTLANVAAAAPAPTSLLSRRHAQDTVTYTNLFGEPVPYQRVVVNAATGGREPVEVPSQFGRGEVTIDVYGKNPLLQDAEQAVPEAYRMALTEGPPPDVFLSGPLPPFTASGVDPAMLLRVPWYVRHYAAAAATAGALLEVVELFAKDPLSADARYQHAGGQAYILRIRDWLVGPQQPVPDLLAPGGQRPPGA